MIIEALPNAAYGFWKVSLRFRIPLSDLVFALKAAPGDRTFPQSTGLSGKILFSMTNLEQTADLERRYLLQTYNRYPVIFERGKGVFLYDLDGKKYLDLVSGIGVNALGYAHPRIVKTIRDQAARLVHISNLYYHEYQGPLAEKLCALSGLQRVFFSNSGTSLT